GCKKTREGNDSKERLFQRDSGTHSGCGVFHSPFRGCRFAQPPATVWHPSGMASSTPSPSREASRNAAILVYFDYPVPSRLPEPRVQTLLSHPWCRCVDPGGRISCTSSGC